MFTTHVDNSLTTMLSASHTMSVICFPLAAVARVASPQTPLGVICFIERYSETCDVRNRSSSAQSNVEASPSVQWPPSAPTVGDVQHQ